MTLQCRSSLTGASLVSQIHDVAIDNDRCKEHSLESLRAWRHRHCCISGFLLGWSRSFFFFPGMTTASDLFCPTCNSSWLACQEPFNKTQNSKCFGLFVWSKIWYIFSHIFSILNTYSMVFPHEFPQNARSVSPWPSATTGDGSWPGLAPQIRSLAASRTWSWLKDAPWEQIPTAREVWNRWSFLKWLKIWRKKCLHGNFMKFCRFSRIDWLSVVNFGWMNLNLLQDFTRCWLCMSFTW